MFTHAYLQRQADAPSIDRMAGLVGNLELTDLSLFTEARYTVAIYLRPISIRPFRITRQHWNIFRRAPLRALPAGLRRFNGKPD